MIRLVKKEDLDDLAVIYKDLYDNADIGEDWSIEKAKKLLEYWYNKQGDLFYVAEEDGKPVGGCVSGIKSWFDGNRLIDGEIFVSKDYQEKHIGRNLMLEHLKQAKIKYNANVMEFHTYGDETEFPQNWYNRIGFKKDDELIIMNGNIEEILGHLGYVVDGKIEPTREVLNYGYSDLIKLYNSLKKGDKAYDFDMIPSYAYVDTKEEREYIESRITAMKNGADFNLIIVGTKEKLDSLKNNELFKYTINNICENGKLYILDQDELRAKCPMEYFQLADGLYYAERNDGSKELFKDLWENKENLGLLIKDNEVINYVEQCIYNIMDKIDNKELTLIDIK